MTVFTGPKRLGPNLDRYTSNPEHELGMVVESAGKRYRYVRFVDAVTYAKGHVVTIASAGWDVTNDRSGGSDIALIPVGVVHTANAPTTGQYGWVQISGIAEVLVTGAGITAGDRLVASGSVDGAAAEADYAAVTHGDFAIIGTALASIASGSTGNVLLDVAG